MNKLVIKSAMFGLATAMLLQACDDKEKAPAPPAPVTDQSYSQGFESLAAAQTQGWVFKNLSDEANGGWTVASATGNGFTPFEGTKLLTTDYTATSGDLHAHPEYIISNWAISPARIIQNGDKISFYTRSHGSIGYGSDGSFGDRLQLRLNVFNTSDSIGKGPTDIGNFTKPLLDINPVYKIAGPGDYPTTWTKYEATVTGLNKPDSGRIALRYFVELNGGANGDEIAVDKFEYISASHP